MSGTIDSKDFDPRRYGVGNNEGNDRVISPETTDNKGYRGVEIDSDCDCNLTEIDPLNGACNVPDYVKDKMRSLPHKLSNSALEKALGIPSTYLSKRGNKSVERKLEEYKDFLSALTPPNSDF